MVRSSSEGKLVRQLRKNSIGNLEEVLVTSSRLELRFELHKYINEHHKRK